MVHDAQQPQQQPVPTGPTDVPALHQRITAAEQDIRQLQTNAADMVDQVDELTVAVEQLPHKLESVLEDSLAATASKEDLNILTGKVDSLLSKMEQLAGATHAIRKPYDKAGVELALSKSQRVHSLRTFGLDWYLHPDVRQHIPLDIYLSQDAEFNDQIRQLDKEGQYD